MLMRRIAASAVWLALLTAAPAAAGGMNCAKASTPVEKRICGDDELKALDGRLAALYTRALNEGQDPQTLRTMQKNWLAERNRCADRDCLFLRHQERIGRLQDYLDAIAADEYAAVGFLPVSEADKRCIPYIPEDAPNAEIRCEVKEWKPLGKAGRFERFHALYHVTFRWNGQDRESFIPVVFAHNPADPSVVAFEFLISNAAPFQDEDPARTYAPRLETGSGGARLIYTFQGMDGGPDVRTYRLNAGNEAWEFVRAGP